MYKFISFINTVIAAVEYGMETMEAWVICFIGRFSKKPLLTKEEQYQIDYYMSWFGGAGDM